MKPISRTYDLDIISENEWKNPDPLVINEVVWYIIRYPLMSGYLELIRVSDDESIWIFRIERCTSKMTLKRYLR